MLPWWFSACFIRSVTLLRWIESRLSKVYQLFKSGKTLSQFQLQDTGQLRLIIIHALDLDLITTFDPDQNPPYCYIAGLRKV